MLAQCADHLLRDRNGQGSPRLEDDSMGIATGKLDGPNHTMQECSEVMDIGRIRTVASGS